MAQTISHKRISGRQLILFPEIPVILYIKGPNYDLYKKEVRRLLRKKALLPVNRVQFTNWINAKLLREGKPIHATDARDQGKAKPSK